MELVQGLKNVPHDDTKCVASIGNFDGVHLGHQHLIKMLINWGLELGLSTTVITFEPHPLEYFTPNRAPARLTTIRHKTELISTFDISRLVCLDFNKELASTEAEAFVQETLYGSLGVRHIIVGDDFRFGKNRRGDFALMSTLGDELGMTVRRMDSFLVDNERVSSRRIREYLASGNLELASKLLGRRYSISGKIERGEGNGAKWGFPTINIVLPYQNVPLTGIFVVEVDGVLDSPVAGAANLGTRPTVGGESLVLEVHLLNFSDDLYGREIRVRFLKKLRDEKKFSSIEKMIEQIAIDVKNAGEYFGIVAGAGLS